MICHKHKFMFIHISKSAGSSITKGILKSIDCEPFIKHQHINDMINHNTANYFKFAFVRNPWDRLVSRYFYAKHHSHPDSFLHLSFKEFIKGGHAHTPMPTDWIGRQVDTESHPAPHLQTLLNRVGFFDSQLEWITDNKGNILVDFIGRCENIQTDFDYVCDKIDIPRQCLTCENKTDHKHYTEYYDNETRQIVAKTHAKDIEYFGYKFK